MNPKIFKSILFCLITTLMFFSSCITPKQTNLLENIKEDMYKTIPPPSEYRVIPGDILRVVVYIYDDESTRQLFSGFLPNRVSTNINIATGSSSVQDDTRGATPIQIYADGTINFPYVGRLFVQGLSLLEIRELLTARLQEISHNASANVTLFNNYFSILGQSGAQRYEMISDNMTILQALSTSGAINNQSDLSRVRIIRQSAEGTDIMTFDIRSKYIVNTQYYYIQPNDVIYFPEKSSNFFGSATSFSAFFGLITSFITIFIGVIRIF